jgi:asparagine synthase (glutamine-hydrolysing)
MPEREMDSVWIADALIGGKSESWRTPYSNIRRIEASQVLEYKHQLNIKSYEAISIKGTQTDVGFEAAVEKMSRLLDNAVLKRAPAGHGLGVELSGGLDSSAIAVILSGEQEIHHSITSFSHVFSKESKEKYFPYKDDYKRISELTKYTGIQTQVYCNGDKRGVIEMLKRSILLHYGPTQQSFSMLSDILYQKAEELSVNYLFSGFGGDEGVSSRIQGYFEILSYNGNYSLLRNEVFHYCKLNGKSKISGLLKLGLLRFSPHVYYTIRRRIRKKHKSFNFSISRAFRSEVNIKNRLKISKGLPLGFDINQRQLDRLMHPHVSQRIAYSYIDAKARNIEYIYPLLDKELLSFYLSLPVEYKFRNGYDRAIFREALKNRLPDSIRLRREKGTASIPTVHQRIANDYRNIEELIYSSSVQNSYHYIDYSALLSWLKELVSKNRNDRRRSHPLAFLNSLQILLLQEMERTGEFKSGIRC